MTTVRAKLWVRMYRTNGELYGIPRWYDAVKITVEGQWLHIHARESASIYELIPAGVDKITISYQPRTQEEAE